ncbi:DUF2062 domain-containing protein [Ramlibacter sp. AN1015]|uniref:DUF2062 domain-containing protein n=1 Tax=Ramlibacter sp. AN1015 TaxID=3133428 RepID=UPI0030C17F99
MSRRDRLPPWLRRLIPTRESIRHNRWLHWLGPALHHPRLWHLSRRGLAMGVAIGIFFGVLIPIAQIPLSAAAAVVLRANLPGAVASTLVTNPATFGPIYYAAWRLGSALIGEPVTGQAPQEMPEADVEIEAVVARESWLGRAIGRLMAIGRPLLLGLTVLAAASGLAAYALISWVWAVRVRMRRRNRMRRRTQT